jgi:hypothetical protein
MAERLLVVKDAFAGRAGVELLPAITSDRVPPSPFEVTLRAPDGAERRARAEIIVAHIRGPLPPLARIRLVGVAVESVPVGTELWVGA